MAIPQSFTEAFERVNQLVSIFSQNEERYLSAAGHDRMVQLVDQMLEAKQQLASARTESDKTFYESKCATLDRQIDPLVYELYDLTPEEIAIAEGQTK